MRCLNCDGEISLRARACPHCGAPRRSRLVGLQVWERAPLRTRATIVGLLLSAVIIAAATLLIITYDRRDVPDPGAPSIIINETGDRP